MENEHENPFRPEEHLYHEVSDVNDFEIGKEKYLLKIIFN